jgi:hypothetical protein
VELQVPQEQVVVQVLQVQVVHLVQEGHQVQVEVQVPLELVELVVLQVHQVLPNHYHKIMVVVFL